MHINAVLFDLDGTIWDSSEEMMNAWNVVLKKYTGKNTLVTPDKIGNFIGLSFQQMKDAFAECFGVSSENIIKECLILQNEYIHQNGAKLYPGIDVALRILHNDYKLYIVSNCIEEYMNVFRIKSGLENYFSGYVSAASTCFSKGENIRILTERLALKAVYVGDTSIDEAAANEAGVPFIHAAYGFGTSEGCLARASSPDELPGLISKLSL